MNIFQAIGLGTLQGITEFLPISSSGHLLLAESLFKIKEAGLSFDVMLHLGTLVALIVFFREDWVRLIRAFLESLKKNEIRTNPDQRLAWFLIIATLPALSLGFVLRDMIETTFRSPLLTILMLILFGLILILAERFSKKEKEMENITLLDSIIIGTAQAISLMPGVSRSGITMTAGLFAGYTRKSAAKFSFLLSTPVIFGAGFADIVSVSGTNFSGIETSVLVAGFIAALVSGFLAIKYLLKFVEKHSLSIFGYYRIAIAILALILFIY